MKAAKLIEPGKIIIEDTERPSLAKDTEVLIKVEAVGICGTDLHIFKEGRADVRLPRVMGHELSGIVEETGETVYNVHKGDRVILDPVISCGICRVCRSGHGNVCADVKCFGVQCDGGFQEYIVADASKVFAFDSHIPFERAALGEPFSIAANILGRLRLLKGERLLVMGAGAIGLAVVQAAKGLGARVLVSDIFDTKLACAGEFGADAVVNSEKTDLRDALRTFAPEGVDAILDAVGLSPMVETALELAEPLTRIAVIGFDGRPAAVPIVQITKKELTLVGSRMNGNRFPQVVEWLNTGVIDDRMISKVYAFADIQEAFTYTAAHPRTTIKTVIRF